MYTRRNLLRFGGSAALVAPFTGFTLSSATSQDGPLFRFGVVSDPQYAPVPPRRTRFYAHSLWKLTDALSSSTPKTSSS
jgi:hypothetical protein